MAIRIRSISKMVENTGLKILIHGMAGSGKTVMSATTGESTLILSAEAGLLSIRNAPKYIKGAQIESIQDLEEVLAFLIEDLSNPDGPKFRWVNLDSITEIAEQVLSKEKSGEKDPRKAYMTMQDEILKIFRKYRDLPYYHVVFTCKQERIDDDGKKIYFPMMPGQKLAQQIPYLFDEVFALRVEKDENGEIYRTVQTSRDAKYEAKDRSGSLDLFEPPSLKKIAAKIFAKEKEDAQEVPVDASGEPIPKQEPEKEKATVEDDVDEVEVVEPASEDRNDSNEEDKEDE